jgi:hypothetical protein
MGNLGICDLDYDCRGLEMDDREISVYVKESQNQVSSVIFPFANGAQGTAPFLNPENMDSAMYVEYR